MPTLDPSDADTINDSEPTPSHESVEPHDGTPAPFDGTPSVHGYRLGDMPAGIHPRDSGIPNPHILTSDEPTLFPKLVEPQASSVPRPLTVSASIYVDDEAAAEVVKAAFTAMIKEFDLEVETEEPPVIGSWFQRLALRIRSAVREPGFTERLATLERALEIQLVDKPQSQVNAADGGAVAALITALDKTDNAMITIGTILLVKANGVVAVRNLSLPEMRLLERNPAWTMDPAAAMRHLQQLQDTNNQPHQWAALQDNQMQL